MRAGLSVPVAPLVAGTVGALTALVIALMPGFVLEGLVLDSGIAAVVKAAEPPLGVTARVVLILGAGGGLALFLWFGLFLLLGNRSLIVQRDRGEDVQAAPVLRRADAHPDAPARRPVFANRDLGTPFLEVTADRPRIVEAVAPPPEPAAAPIPDRLPFERPLPVDLEQPLAAYDAAAIPSEPIDWFPPPVMLAPAPRRQVFAPSERFETFDLSPAPPPAGIDPRRAPEPVRDRPDPSATIHALLDRLERSVPRRDAAPVSPPAPPSREESLQDALSTLRDLARHRA